METNTGEPLIKCRKRRDAIKTRRESLTWDKSGGIPDYCPDGDRHGGGVNVAQASVWNVGTCCSDAKGACQVEDPQGTEYRCGAQGRTGT